MFTLLLIRTKPWRRPQTIRTTSDIGMPGMNGHELMQALRGLPAIAHTPSIALTGYGASTDLTRSGASGFTRHVGKPVNFDQFVEVIVEVCPSRV
ncbi:response regulator [Pseudomonas silvicola]|nr:response regulator [Pseudomonas silvicola]